MLLVPTSELNPFIGYLATTGSGSRPRGVDALVIEGDGDLVVCRDALFSRLALLIGAFVFGPLLAVQFLLGTVPIFFAPIAIFCSWQFVVNGRRNRRIEYRRSQGRMSFFSSAEDVASEVGKAEIQRFELGWTSAGEHGAGFRTLSVVGRDGEREYLCAGNHRKVELFAACLAGLAPVEDKGRAWHPEHPHASSEVERAIFDPLLDLARRQLWAVAALIPLSVGGSFFSAPLIYDGIDVWKARNWTVAEGEVVGSEIESFVIPRGHAGSGAGETRNRTKLTVSYRYRADGKTYGGSRVAFYGFFNSGPGGAALKGEFRAVHAGARYPVRYDPSAPARSIMVPNFPWFWPCLAALGLLAMVYWRRAGSQKTPAHVYWALPGLYILCVGGFTIVDLGREPGREGAIVPDALVARRIAAPPVPTAPPAASVLPTRDQRARIDYYAGPAAASISRAQEATSRGDHEQAVKELTQAIASGGRGMELAETYVTRALELQILRRDAQAVSDFDEAIRLNPDEDTFYLLRGTLLWNMKEKARAKSDCERLRQLNSSLAVDLCRPMGIGIDKFK
jgi:hypothetical protein